MCTETPNQLYFAGALNLNKLIQVHNLKFLYFQNQMYDLFQYGDPQLHMSFYAVSFAV